MCGTTWPAFTFRFEVAGRGVPSAQTVTKIPADGLTAVTFSATAQTFADGTPARPVT